MVEFNVLDQIQLPIIAFHKATRETQLALTMVH